MRKLQLENSEIGTLPFAMEAGTLLFAMEAGTLLFAMEAGTLLFAMEAGVKPELHTVQSYTSGGRRLFQLWDQLYVHKDILWRRFESKDGRESIAQLVVPRAARECILKEIHNSLTSAHLGEQKTLSS